MEYHQDVYIQGDPRVQPASEAGLHRPKDLPDVMDVLIVGEGPAGMITFAQLSQFPDLTVRLVEKRGERLERGHADGIHSRSLETFQAFGFAKRMIEEAQVILDTNYWKPDPANPSNIIRQQTIQMGREDITEFCGLGITQARVQQYLAEVAYNSPGRMTPDFGIEFVSHSTDESQAYPVEVTLRRVSSGETFKVRTKYLVGADGARSQVRRSIGAVRLSEPENHAWGVMDVLCDTDFPDIRLMNIVQSRKDGTVIIIGREGGQLSRLYVQLGETHDDPEVRNTPQEVLVEKLNKIMHPYKVEIKHTYWKSVYVVARSIADRFDDVTVEERGQRDPRAFILGDACHTHSAKAGQGMNVSMQDGFNLGWKLGQVLMGVAPKSLLSTYNWERKVIAQELIDFDTTWYGLVGSSDTSPEHVEKFQKFIDKSFGFPSGFMTQYTQSMITGTTDHQDLAKGYPVGMRFKSAKVNRRSDRIVYHLGHLARADGKWRMYVFADRPKAGDKSSAVEALAEWLVTDNASPFAGKRDQWIEAKVIYQQNKDEFEFFDAPVAFRPRYGKYDTMQYGNVFNSIPNDDIFDVREVSRDGAIVVVRPDQYVAQVLPLTATKELGEFFDGVLLRE